MTFLVYKFNPNSMSANLPQSHKQLLNNHATWRNTDHTHSPSQSTMSLIGHAYQDRTSTGASAQKQFWLDALPAATNDSYGCLQEISSSLSCAISSS